MGLLVLGVAGGLYLGHGGQVQQRSAGAQLVVASDTTEVQLLTQRQNAHAAARAWQRQAEGDAAAKAAAEARAAADRARKLEKKAIDKKAAAEKAKKDEADGKSGSSSGKEVPYTGPVPDSCNEFTGNRKIGCAIMLDKGFKIDQFPCLNKLFNRESNWRTKAANPSGAYGIPQALPGSKMASVAPDWRTNPITQIEWGLDYIADRYGTPCAAWGHSESVGWY